MILNKEMQQPFTKEYHGKVIDEMSEVALKNYAQTLNWEIRVSYWFFTELKGSGPKADRLGGYLLFLYDICEYVHYAYRRRLAQRLMEESPVIRKYAAMGVIR
jgi:hypothetical protein